MKIDSSFLQLQLEYSRWASDRSLEAARVLSEEELLRDLGNSYGGVMGTLLHIFQGDRIWASRLVGTPRMTLADPDEVWTLETLTADWTRVADQYQQWVEGITDTEQILHYTNLAGKQVALPYWQVILHIVNHASYHRGQITTMLRQLGATPISTDLHTFYLIRG